jgi:F-type H+-transporting ATPase subunit b
MNKVAAEAKAESVRLLEVVRQESDALRSQLQLALKSEQLDLQEALSNEVRHEVFEIARKALSDLAESSLEVSMANVFLKRLTELSEQEKTHLQSTFKNTNQSLIVHTAFDLPQDSCTLIKEALEDILGNSVDTQFSTVPNIISGIEINANGQKIAWSIDDYLVTLNKHVDHILESKEAVQTQEDVNPHDKESVL